MRIAAVGVVLVMVQACGRIAFDPLEDAGGSGPGPSDSGGSGTGDGGFGGGPDATVTACAGAITVSLGTTSIDTCSAGVDLLDGCGPAGTEEVVLRFDVPTSRGYQFAAYNPGTLNVSNSTGVVNAACAATASCSGVLGTSLMAGETVFIALEAASGGCATVDFNIQ